MTPSAQSIVDAYPNLKVGSSFRFMLRATNTANANSYTFSANASGGTLLGFSTGASGTNKNIIIYRIIFTSLSPPTYSIYRLSNYTNPF